MIQETLKTKSSMANIDVLKSYGIPSTLLI